MAVDSGAVLRSFEGHAQKNFIIRSAFGGASEGFVVSGSEGLSRDVGLRRGALMVADSNVYIWRTSGELIDVLKGHTQGCVNAVAWNPTIPGMMASAGDDGKVRM
jgi:WD40 repeat protein